MGYGDIGTFGHPTIKTPNLDLLASEGQKWINFYVAASVCTPSRAGLLTGKLPVRNGMCSGKRRVLYHDSKGGLPDTVMTISSVLKSSGYKTACIGKWHLGHHLQYLPNAHGFDYFFGIPYSNDMDKPEGIRLVDVYKNPKTQYFNVPLMRDSAIIERPANQSTITRRYTMEAVSFIEENNDRPFFLYLAHSMPHVPLFRSDNFKNRSLRGIYGDVIEEIDWSTGEIMHALKDNGIEKRTLVVFTSDNGPWKSFKTHGGSSGILKGQKGGTFEGGMREPCIFWWQEKLKTGTIADLGTTMDLLPTFCHLAKIDLPNEKSFDGCDLSPVLFGTGTKIREVVYYYRGTKVYAIRKGAYKAHFITQPEFGSDKKTIHDPPLLYNLNVDPGEEFNIAKEHPKIIKEIKEILNEHLAAVKPVENQLEK